jgi:hypothetical protein
MAVSRCSRALVLLVAGTLLLSSGCGYPEVQPVNMELITSLRTACSAREPKWLEANVEKIDAQKATGQMSDEEHATFMAIVEQARSGDWESAELACLKFQKAQGPTSEQMEKMRAFHAE